MLRALALLPLIAACSGERRDEPAAKPAPPPAPVPPPADAAAPPSDGITEIGAFDAASGMHLDEEPPAPRVTPPHPANRAGKAIDIILKSSPAGAMAAVDGVQLGPTPTYWPAGEADGREHEFTFVLRGFAVARYRFVPIASGVIHARLEPIAEERPVDAGFP